MSFNPLRIGAIPQMNPKLSVRQNLSRFNPLRIGAIPQIPKLYLLDKWGLRFQSPQNRGYSSDNIKAMTRLFCISSFNPLRIGAIPQMRLQRPRSNVFHSVSIPSESGLFLR